MFSRVETCFPIDDPALKKRIYKDGLLNYLADNQLAWDLQSDGTWMRVEAGADEPAHQAQAILLEKLSKI